MRTVLESFGVPENTKSVVSPLPHDAKLKRWEGEATDRVIFDYMRFVGCMQWLVMSTRPDLAQATGVLARYTNNPGPDHVEAAYHVLKYLCGTPDLGITYYGSSDVLGKGMITETRDCVCGCRPRWLFGYAEVYDSYVIMVNGGAVAGAQRNRLRYVYVP